MRTFTLLLLILTGMFADAVFAQPLSVTGTAQPVLCFGESTGSIGITVTGGNAPYSYLWSNGAITEDISGLIAGTYTVTVTDAASTDVSGSWEVYAPSDPLTIANPVTTNNTCNGGASGTISLTISGGTPPYTFLWSNFRVTEDVCCLLAGCYTVTVTDFNNCKTTGSWCISEPPALEVAEDIISVSCFGLSDGAIDLTVSGGTPDYEFLWSNGFITEDISGLPSAAYSVTITDGNGCQTFRTYPVTQPMTLVVSGSPVSPSCNESTSGYINITSSGGTEPYTYLWSTGATSQNISGLTSGTYTVTVTDKNGCSASGNWTLADPVTIANSATTDNNCHGGASGTISLTISGGTPPYTFLWSNFRTSKDVCCLLAGCYTVTVTDANSCTATGSWCISEPPALEVAEDITAVSCHGLSDGAINLTVSGGTPDYEFLWSNGLITEDISGLSSAAYSVTITDGNGCQTFRTYPVTQPMTLVVSGSPVSPSCDGGSNGYINITASGGTEPFTYLWNTGAGSQNLSSLAAGTYTVTVTDKNGCIAIGNWPLTAPPALGLTLVPQDVSCGGGTDGLINLTVTGGTPPMQYLWSTGATSEDLTGLVAGTYTVTVTDHNGCVSQQNATINQPDPLSVTGTAVPTTCNGGNEGAINITVTGGSGSYAFIWSNSASSQNISGLNAGIYTVTVTDGNNCQASGSWEVLQPDPIVLDPGPNQDLCQQNMTVLAGNWPAPGATGNWTLVSRPAGAPLVTPHPSNSPMAVVTGLVAHETQPYVFRYTISQSLPGGGVCSAYEDIEVWNKHYPSPPYAGTDRNLCINPASPIVNMNAASPLYGTGVWSEVAGNPPSIIANIYDPHTQITYTIPGTYAYLWTVNNGSCVPNEPNHDTVVIKIYSPPVVDAGPDMEMCSNSSVTIDGSSASGQCIMLHWSSLGDGSFNNPALLHPVYTPGSGDIAAGGVRLVLKGSIDCCNPCGPASVTDTMELVIHPSPTASVSGTDALCHGSADGTLTVTVSSGTPDFGYLWSNGQTGATATGLVAGTYSVTVTDHFGCTASAEGTVGQPSGLQLSGTVNDVSCNGGTDGSVNITVTGGTSPYTFLWSDGSVSEDPDHLAAGTYTVTVTDANLCQISDVFVINEPPVLGFSNVSVLPTLCNGSCDGSIGVSVTGGTSPYYYLWNTGETTSFISGLCAGDYTLTVTDAHSCELIASWPVTSPLPLTVTGVMTAASCNQYSDGKIHTTTTGGTGSYTYLWNTTETTPDISGLLAGTYTVTVTDANNCIDTASWTVTEPGELSWRGQGFDALCHGSSDGHIEWISTEGGTPPYYYIWNTGATTPGISNLVAGSYTITVTDAHSCDVFTTTVIGQPDPLVPDPTGTMSEPSCFTYSDGSITLAEATGGTGPYTYLWNTGAATRDLSGVAAGTYTVTVTDAHLCTANENYTINEAPEWSIGILGDLTGCCNTGTGSAPFTYTAAIGGAYSAPVSYEWVVTGGQILTGHNGPFILVKWDCCGTGTVSLTVTQGPKNCVLTTSITVSVTPAPQPVISGPVDVMSNTGGHQYCVPFVADHLYSWSISGGTITSGDGTNCVTVEWGNYPTCGCGSLTVCESDQSSPGVAGCTGCYTLDINITPNPDSLNIRGYVKYDNGQQTPLNGVTVTLRNATGNVIGTATTSNNLESGEPGFFGFTNVPDGQYTLRASSNAPWGGNNATDALIVQLFIAGFYPLNPFHQIVADVNQNQIITALDALYIKLRTIGSINSYPAGDWKFGDTTFQLVDSADFVIPGLCTGDVNGSNLPIGLKNGSSIGSMAEGLIHTTIQEPFEYLIRSNRSGDLGAMTLNLRYDDAKYRIDAIHSPLGEIQYRTENGIVRLAWSADERPVISTGDPLFVFHMRARAQISEPEMLFTIAEGSEFADPLASLYEDYQIKMAQVVAEQKMDDIVMTASPNPFAEVTAIDYILPESGKVKLTLTDMVGKTISVLTDLYQEKGSHQVRINGNDLHLLPGLYLFKLELQTESMTYSKIKRMVFTK